MAHHLSRTYHVGLSSLLLAVLSCASTGKTGQGSSSANEFVVNVSPVPDRTPDRWRGMTNIFFDSIPDALKRSIQIGEEWSAVQVAEIVDGAGVQTIRALRYKPKQGADVQYAVDTAGDLDFRRAQLLTFERRGVIRVASLDLTVTSTFGSQRRVPYQVLVADDGYTYARIADFRRGELTIGGQSYTVVARNRSRNHPFYDASENTVFFVDLDRDGALAEQATVRIGGRALAAEQVMPGLPFLLQGRPFELTSVDSVGSELRIVTSTQRVAAATQFRAPEIRADLITGGEVRLSQKLGGVVLIGFWATDCPYSEKVRTSLNALALSRGQQLTWLAMARERDRGSIDAYLRKAPMQATVTFADSAAWRTYNPLGATPMFVVVDQRGIIQFTAAGLSGLDAVTTTIDRLLQISAFR